MRKTGLFVIIVVAVVGIGIALSFYGNQIVFEDLEKDIGKISVGKNLKISSDISKEASSGIYAVEIIDKQENTVVTAKILDPYNSQIASDEINVERFEEKFEISEEGTYQLILETNSEKEVQVFGVIGPEPGPGKKSIGFISFYILIVGLVGMSAVAIYAMKNRRQ